MNVACPECASVFRVDPAKVPQAGVRARCSVCGGVIPIGIAGWVEDDFDDLVSSAPPARPLTAPIAPSPAGGQRSRPALPPRPSTTLPTPPQPSRAQLAELLAPLPKPRSATPAAALPATPAALTPPAQPAQPLRRATPARPAAPVARATPIAPPPIAPIRTPPARPAVPVQRPTLATPATPQPAAPQPAPSPRPPINPFLANDPNVKAKRLARALVSDIVTYYPDKHKEALRNESLRELFREEIKKSYEEYVEQMGRDFAESTSHFQDALNDVLAGGKKVF